MKKIVLSAMFLLGCLNAKAQTSAKEGNWVVESNQKTPKHQTVKFYNSNEELIYEERYSEKILRIRRKKVRDLLDKTLNRALYAQPEKGEKVLARNLKK